MTSVDGSNRLRILPSTWVSPWKDACPRLLHHAPQQRHHPVEFRAQSIQRNLLHGFHRPLYALRYLG
jgi:hypothetical protein